MTLKRQEILNCDRRAGGYASVYSVVTKRYVGASVSQIVSHNSENISFDERRSLSRSRRVQVKEHCCTYIQLWC